MPFSMIKPMIFIMLIIPGYGFSLSVTYFSLTSMPPVQQEVHVEQRVCFLDDFKNLKRSLTDTIYKQMASKQYRDLVKNNKDMFDKLSAAALCQYDAIKLGVKGLPAVVFENKYVVYGQRDISLAVLKYNNYKGVKSEQ
jgi:integrating conjugative element protein (TIGR03757 family)